MKKILPISLGMLLVVVLSVTLFETALGVSLPRTTNYNEQEALHFLKNKFNNRQSSSRVAKSTTSVEATVTAFGGSNRYFLAGAPSSAATQTLSIAQLSLNPDGTTAVNMMPIAPATPITVNGLPVLQSPFTSQQVNNLTLAGPAQKAIVAAMLAQPGATDTAILYPNVYLLTKDDGTQLIGTTPTTISAKKFSGFLLDTQTNPKKVINAPVALAATGSDDGDFIIAAVPQENTSWNGQAAVAAGATPSTTFTPSTKPAVDGRGLAVMVIKNNATTQNIGVVNVHTFNGSLPLNGFPESDVLEASQRTLLQDKSAFTFFAPKDAKHDPRACLGNTVDMYWDSILERLYIGLSNVSRGDVNGNPNPTKNFSAGVCQVLVGKFSTVAQPSGEGGEGGESALNVAMLHRNFRSSGESGSGESGSGESAELAHEIDFAEVVGFEVDPVIKNASSYLFPDVLTSDGGVTLGNPAIASQNVASKYPLGFYRNNTQNKAVDKLFATANKVRTMHTSTGNSYLIINGGVAPSLDGVTPPTSLNVQMYAMPLVDNGPDDPSTGFVARNDDITKPIDLQPLVDAAMSNAMGDQDVTSRAIFNLYNQQGNTDTYSLPGTSVSDITNQASFRRFVKKAMPFTSNAAQRIGGIEDPTKINQLLSYDGSTTIADVQVVGDTVYVGAASVRDTNHFGEAGIFSSTALFNPTGEIRAWTPWQRVMGNTDAAYGLGFDKQSRNYWYFTTPTGIVASGTAASQVNVTQWGIGDPSLHGSSTPTDTAPLLSTVIDTIFADYGGIFGLFNFGPDTPGFKVRIPGDLNTPVTRHEQFGMMVATGAGQIAIIETGSLERSGVGVFQPTVGFTQFTGGTDLTIDLNATVYPLSGNSPNNVGDVLRNLGNITSAEVSRLPVGGDNNFQGWLFVGGDGGVGVFVQDYQGSGWDTSFNKGLDRLLPGDQFSGIGSSSLDFPGGYTWFFVQLKQKIPATATAPEDGMNIFNGVRKLISDGDKYLYILTSTALFRIEMNYTNFSSDVTFPNLESHIDPANIAVVATMYSSVLKGSSPQTTIGDTTDQLFDVMVVQRDKTVGKEKSTLLLATSNGMFLSDQITDVVAAPSAFSWQQVTPVSKSALGPVFSFDFASTQRGQTMVSTVNSNGATILSAEGNLTVKAFDPTFTYLATYRFNVTGGTVQPFQEVFNTDYFYKIGTLIDPGNTQSNQLQSNYPLHTRTTNFPAYSTDFSTNIPIIPDPSNFVKDLVVQEFQPIDLGNNIQLPLAGESYVRNDSSGAVYVGGEFGVRVNE